LPIVHAIPPIPNADGEREGRNFTGCVDRRSVDLNAQCVRATASGRCAKSTVTGIDSLADTCVAPLPPAAATSTAAVTTIGAGGAVCTWPGASGSATYTVPAPPPPPPSTSISRRRRLCHAGVAWSAVVRMNARARPWYARFLRATH
jgi:hypothetical protein